MAKQENSSNYINNDQLLEEFIVWRQAWKELSDMDPEIKPPPSDYMVKAFIEIPTRFIHTPKFNGYTYKDDLIGQAIYAILKYYWKFDPEVSKNPFAFLTQIAYYTFISEIQKERKESYVKFVSTNDFLQRGEGQFSEEEQQMVQENTSTIFNRHYNESLVAHHDGTVNRIKKHNKIVENSIENLLCPDYDPEELKKELP